MRSKGLNREGILHSRMSDSFVPSNRPSLIDVSISITYSNNRRGEEAGAGAFAKKALRQCDEFLLRCEATWDLE